MADLPDLRGYDLSTLSRSEREKLFLVVDELSVRKSRESMKAFSTRQGYVPARHHEFLIKHLEMVERKEIKNLMVCMPPGSSKSTYSSIIFPAWYMGKHPKDCVIGASNNMELAERFGRKARAIVGGADFRRIFACGLSEESAAAARWELDKGGEYFGVGVSGSVVGRRADLLCLDDVVKSREDVNNEFQRDKVWDWYKTDILTRLKPNARQVFVNTRWHQDDLSGRILENFGKEWVVLNLEMENTKEDDPLGRAIGERLWPEWFTDEMVERAKADVGTWNALYQQNPVPDGGGEFKKGWVEYYDTLPPLNRVAPIILVDPAGRKDKKSDYTAIWVIGVGSDGYYYVLDIVRDRLNLAERTDVVFKLHRKWKARVVRYEEYGLQSDIEHIKGEMDRRVYRFKIQKVAGTRVKKEDRIRRLIPDFKDGKMLFPRSFMYTDLNGKTSDLVHVFVEEELCPFPVAKHDDLLDSLSRLVEPGLIIPKQVSEEDRELERVEGFEPFDSAFGY